MFVPQMSAEDFDPKLRFAPDSDVPVETALDSLGLSRRRRSIRL